MHPAVHFFKFLEVQAPTEEINFITTEDSLTPQSWLTLQQLTYMSALIPHLYLRDHRWPVNTPSSDLKEADVPFLLVFQTTALL